MKTELKTVISLDSFKGSLGSVEAGEAVREGILRVFPDADVSVFPLADGGEGTVDALTVGMGGELREVTVSDPLGRKISAGYGIVNSGNTAVIEMSAAAGLTLLKEDERDPMHTTTYGVGEIIKDAINTGCRDFIIGIGGSATNDCGIGMLQALGFGFPGDDGREVPYGAKGAGLVTEIRTDAVIKELKDCRFRVACDVNNPLFGENGASLIYGPQKGADDSMTKQMDSWLRQFSDIVKKYFPGADPGHPGAGAAGGMGFAFRTFLGGSLERGIDIVMKETGLEEHISEADIIVTGEGRIDRQTAMGKAPIGVAGIAKKYGKTVIAFAGSIGDGAEECNARGIDAFFPIVRQPGSLEQAIDPDNARRNLADTAEQVFRMLGCQGIKRS